jgi:hypothetical protein
VKPDRTFGLLLDFVSHRFLLRDVEVAVRKSIAPDFVKVAIAPWWRVRTPVRF